MADETPDIEALQPAAYAAELRADVLEIALAGDWLLAGRLPDLTPLHRQIGAAAVAGIRISGAELGRWDSLLVIEILSLTECAAARGAAVDLAALPAAVQGLLALARSVPERGGARGGPPPSLLAAFLTGFARLAVEIENILTFTGELTIATAATLSGRRRFRRADLWLFINECGPSALPIVSLISLLVGLILAFVGALQLSMFGAQIYIANLVSLGMTREMGGLMTAVIMAGRTGAAYAAQLGTMHVNDEIDALKTMNLEPMAFLATPRMLALTLIMPLLCLYADLMGMLGGGIVAISLFDVSLAEYLDRAANAVQFKDFLVGFVKCSVFGVLIALAGCMRGMQCGRSASAVGDAATSAVVTSIVFIVVADSIMTILCNRLGI